MIDKIQQYIEQNSLFSKTDKLLITVSGGIDSMVCLDIMQNLGYKTGIAHCNFNLRAEESDDDEEFVKKTAKSLDVRFHTISFNTTEYARDKGLSIQMAARELRYEWFEKIRAEYDYQDIIVAHHLDDSIETILINLSRGTGLSGLSGISNSNGFIKRPLLTISREELLEYANTNNIEYREDSSNQKTKYSRNRIRHKVIPELEAVNPALKKSFLSTIHNLTQEKEVLFRLFEELKLKIVKEVDDGLAIDIMAVTQSKYRDWLLFRTLDKYGFSKQQIESINESLEKKVGLQFFSPGYMLTIDREYIYLTSQFHNSKSEFTIQAEDTIVDHPIRLEMSTIDIGETEITNDPNTAFLDADTLNFPLSLSHWKSGDSFKPLGLSKFQKLSDFFVNSKIPRHKKNSVWILRSNDQIVWLLGLRIDHRNRIRKETKRVFKIQIKD